MISRIDIHGHKGTPMRAVLIHKGERYLNNTTVAEQDLIEFYDLRNFHTLDGQFITRYHAETIMADVAEGHGLDLMMHEPDWKIGPDTRMLVKDWYDYLNKETTHAF